MSAEKNAVNPNKKWVVCDGLNVIQIFLRELLSAVSATALFMP